ncbi:MAG: Vitamin K epoxide reductase, partial [Parcubacteria group bacterium GW2011_GWF1_52_5]
LLAFLYLDSGRKWIENAMPLLGFTGFLFTLWFVYLQIFVIEAICFYCMVSALLSTTIFALALAAFLTHRGETAIQD